MIPGTAADEFLQNVRQTVADRQEDVPMPDCGLARLTARTDDLKALFVERARQAGMEVSEVSRGRAVERILAILRRYRARSVYVSGESLLRTIGLARKAREAALNVLTSGASDKDLLAVRASVTCVAYGVAETGSILLMGGPQCPRQASLVAPIHIAVVREDQILPDLLDLMATLRSKKSGPLPAGMCLVTGPSKSADIELALVKGVHGPREEHIILLPPRRKPPRAATKPTRRARPRRKTTT